MHSGREVNGGLSLPPLYFSAFLRFETSNEGRGVGEAYKKRWQPLSFSHGKPLDCSSEGKEYSKGTAELPRTMNWGRGASNTP